MRFHAIRVAKSLPFRSLMPAAAGLAALGCGAWPGEAAALGPPARRQWTLQATADPKIYELNLHETRGGSTWGNSLWLPHAAIQGLPAGGLDTNQSDITLRFKRDAGTVVATGSIRGGRGEGSFEIELDPAYAAELERRGVGRPSAEQQRRLLHADASFAFLDVLQARGYPVPGIELFVRCADHGVDREFVQDLASAGYRLDSIEALVHIRDHGVDADFVRELAAVGLRDLDIDELVRARDHGVDAAYVRAMHDAGYGPLTLAQAIRARDHGVDATFAKQYRRRYGRPATLDELIHARDTGG